MDQDPPWYGGRPHPMRHCLYARTLVLRAHTLHPLDQSFNPPSAAAAAAAAASAVNGLRA